MIKTNKLVVNFNKGKIQEDFDIYKLSNKKEDFFKANILDLPQEEFMARSVVYTYGSACYVMFDKNTVDKDIFKNAINQKSLDTTVEKVDLIIDDIYPNILARLLFNLLYSRDKGIKYNNISGKLYYMNRKWMKKREGFFYCIEVELDKDMYIKLSVKTFSKLKLHNPKDIKNKSRYIIDPKDGLLKRKLKSDNLDEYLIYIQKSLKSQKNTIDFLKIGSIKKFSKCKLYILDKFMNDVRYELNDYITIENGGYENYNSIIYNKNDNIENKDYLSLLNNKDLIIEDLVSTDKSKKLVNDIISILEKNYKIKAKKGILDRNNFNLRIINEKDYYEKNNLEDPHNNIDRDIIVQHMTVESFDLDNVSEKNESKNKLDISIGNVLQELIVKENIINNRITLVDWKKYGYNLPWTFVMRKKLDAGDDKKDDKYIYCKMKIFEDGKFDIEFYNTGENQFLEDGQLYSEFDIIEEVYTRYSEKNKRENIEGLLYKSIDNINVILKTNEFVLPNYEELKSILEKINPEQMLDIRQIISCVEKFESANENNKKRAEENTRRDEFLAELKTFANYEPREKVNKALKFGRQAGKIINDYLYEKEKILINESFKTSDGKRKYFDAVIDIKYVEKDDRVSYFVGLKSMSDLKFGLSRAVLVRDIKGEENIEFEEISKLLQVEFVRYKMYTVMPFPFKYLREALKMI